MVRHALYHLVPLITVYSSPYVTKGVIQRIVVSPTSESISDLFE